MGCCGKKREQLNTINPHPMVDKNAVYGNGSQQRDTFQKEATPRKSK